VSIFNVINLIFNKDYFFISEFNETIKMKITFTFLFILFLTQNFYTQDLPHSMTEEESLLWKNYINPVNPLFSDPPTSPVRGMAEWEELQGVIITWTSQLTILRQIVDYAQEEGIVYIICSDSNSVKNYLQAYNIPLHNLDYLITGYNSIWVRDYGPWTAYTNDYDTLNVIDWIYNRPRPLDDVTPVFFANYIDAPIYQTTTPPYNLIHTGGNIMIDGHGTAFSSNLVLDENPGKTESQIDEIMNLYLGIDRYIKMENLPYDGIHHIDMHMKLLDEETLLVGEYPPGVADGPFIEANLQYVLDNFQTCFGRDFKVVRIPMPPDQNGNYPPSGQYRTYTNSMIVNKTVIVPTYEYQYDTTALRIYREAMPGYNIVGINCNSIIGSLGAIHCIMKEVGVSEPVWISHAKMDSVIYSADSIEVSAVIKTKSGVANASVFWSTDTSLGFTSSSMQFVSEDSAVGYITTQIDSTVVYYYISATSNSGRSVNKPLVAPDGFYKFMVENSVTNVTELIQPEDFILYQNYPNPFNPVTSIQYAVNRRQIVSLKVFDVLGNEVTTLVNEEKSAGSYEVEFTSHSGLSGIRELSSGIYFYTLRAGTFIQTKKMLLLK